MDIYTAVLEALARDPNVDPALARVLNNAYTKADPRRFFETPVTPSAFAPMSDERRREISDEEYADQLRDERAERNERGL